MPDYRRNRVPGGTFFFTVNLLDRHSDLLVSQIDALRNAVSAGARPRAFPHRRLSCFPTTCTACGPCRKAMPIPPVAGARSRPHSRNQCLSANRGHSSWPIGANAASGSGGTGSIRSATIRTSPLTWTTRISTQSSTVWWNTRRIGRTPRFGGASPAGCIRARGLAAAASHKKRASGGETKPEGGAAQGGTAA
jgi:hypothetical protein